MGYNPSYHSKDGTGAPGEEYGYPPGGGEETVRGLDTSSFPVDNVSWEDARAFCAKLSALPEEVKAGRVYRLPTEAEWEYACRAGTRTPFHFGAALSSGQANFDGKRPYGGAPKGPSLGRTCKVGSYAPNAWGVYDMHGNVAQWCEDRMGKDYYGLSPEIDPRGPESGTARVLRGGTFTTNALSCRSAYRDRGMSPELRSYYFGFRVVCPTPAERGRASP
jgi:formylglycine-generating enzyme required for sulfatase activity